MRYTVEIVKREWDGQEGGLILESHVLLDVSDALAKERADKLMQVVRSDLDRVTQWCKSNYKEGDVDAM